MWSWVCRRSAATVSSCETLSDGRGLDRDHLALDSDRGDDLALGPDRRDCRDRVLGPARRAWLAWPWQPCDQACRG